MAQIKTLLKEQDNIEKIRDHIGFLLAAELANQYALAQEYAPEAPPGFDPEDFNVKVYIENRRPWELENLPVVNVLVLGEKEPEGNPGAPLGNQKYICQFQIDCYARGRHENLEEGIIPQDQAANIRAWLVSRLVRSILMADENLYLGLRGIVQRRMVLERKTVDLEDLPASAIPVSLCRIILEVETFETNPKGEYESFDGMTFKVSTADGKIILADIKTPPYKEEA
jgi:hypothetical protein